MIPILYAGVCTLFCLTFIGLRILPRAAALCSLFRGAAGILTDPALSERAKETAIRRTAFLTGARALDLGARLLGVAGVAGAPVLAAALTGGADPGRLIAFAVTPMVLLLTVVTMMVVHRLWRRSMRRADGR